MVIASGWGIHVCGGDDKLVKKNVINVENNVFNLSKMFHLNKGLNKCVNKSAQTCLLCIYNVFITCQENNAAAALVMF